MASGKRRGSSGARSVESGTVQVINAVKPNGAEAFLAHMMSAINHALGFLDRLQEFVDRGVLRCGESRETGGLLQWVWHHPQRESGEIRLEVDIRAPFDQPLTVRTEVHMIDGADRAILVFEFEARAQRWSARLIPADPDRRVPDWARAIAVGAGLTLPPRGTPTPAGGEKWELEEGAFYIAAHKSIDGFIKGMHRALAREVRASGR